MAETKKEFESKLLKANSVEEVMDIMKEAGVEASAEEAQKAFEKVKEHKESDGKELSLDELDAVAGGGWRHWYKDEGCQATVEYGSDCWGVDGGCDGLFNTYVSGPVNVKCECGRYMFKKIIIHPTYDTEAGILGCHCGKTLQIDIRVYNALEASH